jgi:hypothetical protein
MSPRSRSNAFCADYKAFFDFNKKNALLCHQLHFFQMATEKLGKSLESLVS